MTGITNTGWNAFWQGSYRDTEYPITASGFFNFIDGPDYPQYITIMLNNTGDVQENLRPYYNGHEVVSVPNYEVITAMQYCETVNYEMESYQVSPTIATGTYYNDGTSSWITNQSGDQFKQITCVESLTGEALHLPNYEPIYQNTYNLSVVAIYAFITALVLFSGAIFYRFMTIKKDET